VRRFLVSVVASLAACVSLPMKAVPTERDPTVPWHVGEVGMFYGQVEQSAILRHVNAWAQVWRAPVSSIPEAESVMAQLMSHTPTSTTYAPILLLVETVDLPLVQQLSVWPLRTKLWGIELGNELTGEHSSAELHAFWQQGYDLLRRSGFTGYIVSGGIANTHGDTLESLKTAVGGLPMDLTIGWHAYGTTEAEAGQFLAIIGGRPQAMTEFGIDTQSQASESAAAQAAYSMLELVYRTGSLAYIDYQLHDAPAPGPMFGLLSRDGRWRQREQVLSCGSLGLQPGCSTQLHFPELVAPSALLAHAP
jgi:hypothetical protein